jgi:general secretion pathway protein K
MTTAVSVFSCANPCPKKHKKGAIMPLLKKMLADNRGIALLITLSVTTILVAAALEYNRRARFEVISTASVRDRLTLSYVASSGIHVAMALLIKDKGESNFDTLEEDWANPEKIDEILQEIPFEKGKLAINITDELGKVQVNALVRFPDSRQVNESQVMLWERLLGIIGNEDDLQDDSSSTAIVNSVKDWLDSGDDEATTGLSGAESSYYEEMDPPYASRNGPLEDLNELLLIKGITPQLFYGTEDVPGLVNYMTVHGMAVGAGTEFNWPGRININTAPIPVLAALLGTENQDLAQTLFEFRQEIAAEKDVHDFSNPKWYKNITGLSDVTLDSNMITVTSDVFRIQSTASLDSIQSSAIAVVKRIKNPQSGQWSCKVLSWETR